MSEKNNNLLLPIVSGIIVLVLIIAGIVYVVNSNNDNDDDNNNENTTEMESVMVGGELMYPDQDIIENISRADNLSILVQAVTAADLVDTLKGDGPFTVFGPTNDAFGKLDQALVADLLKPENKADLQNILTYHVVSGRYAISDLSNGQVLTTVQGTTLEVRKEGNRTIINNAVIETPDVFQSNGVAHVIDTVLIPDPEQSKVVGGSAMLRSLTINQNIRNADNLTTVVQAIDAAGLGSTLDSAGPFTVFGPDNAAFEKLPAGTVTTLLDPNNKDQLTGVLTYHVVSGIYRAEDLTDGLVLTTVNGATLTVVRNGNVVSIKGIGNASPSIVTTADVPQSNGVAHIIDSVLLPQ
jgi:uncharacterized surface protein with fasciclin (FAS1) repeats